MLNMFTMLLAGGKGERLQPLTEHRAKPAVPFGGKYRIIDFTLSNCLNSGLRKVAVLIQYKSHSLDRHIRTGWNIMNAELGEYIASIPPQQRISEEWYQGTADAVYQNLFLLDTEQPDYVLILAGDHIYKMNYMEMFHWLLAKGADAVVGAIDIPIEDAHRFGVIHVDEDFRITDFIEKPTHPPSIPNDPTRAFGSMGIYLFRTNVLREQLIADSQEGGSHDFGKNIIPRMIRDRPVYAYKFVDVNKKDVKYWRDIGTLDAYWEANMDLVAVDPLFHRPNSSSRKTIKAAEWAWHWIPSSVEAASSPAAGYKTPCCRRTSACKTMRMCANRLSWKTSSLARTAVSNGRSSTKMSSSRLTRKSDITGKLTPGNLPLPNPAWS
jgi:glucose-1-phosphate adenylyltransferase